jgi:hypothetical protein
LAVTGGEESVLDEIRLVFPGRELAFGRAFLGCIAAFGTLEGDCCRLNPSDARYLPVVSVGLGDVAVVTAEFIGDQGRRGIPLVNATGVHRENPSAYGHISLHEFARRSAGLDFAVLDHIGFDLPWFDGVHPEVLGLRSALAESCAYYRFPTGEDWDFILPATAEEIVGREPDLSQVRRPKFEIVSIDKVSVPIVQVDVITGQPYDDLVRLFPEALAAPGLRNIWVYLENPYGIDLCLVLNEGAGHLADWSPFFQGHRLHRPA